jgi:hypothetical protein
MGDLLSAYSRRFKGDTGEPGIKGAQGDSGVNALLTMRTPTFTSNNYTLKIADSGATLLLSNAAVAGTLTVPPDSEVAFSIGAQILLTQTGTGTITATAGSGVTINSANGYLDFSAQYAGATLLKTAANTWSLFGNLA